jgi:hypothetical protein
MAKMEDKLITAITVLIEQNKKLKNKLNNMEETLEVVADSVNTLIEIQLKK